MDGIKYKPSKMGWFLIVSPTLLIFANHNRNIMGFTFWLFNIAMENPS
jgi:hypothetical protein